MRLSILIAAALTSGTAAAQQLPSDTGNATRPITILKNMAPEPGGVVARINGYEVDHLQTASYLDITGSVHAGSNDLTVTWSGPIQRLDFKIAYAPKRNNFRNVLVVNADAGQDPTLRQPGSQTFAFTIPN